MKKDLQKRLIRVSEALEKLGSASPEDQLDKSFKYMASEISKFQNALKSYEDAGGTMLRKKRDQIKGLLSDLYDLVSTL